MTDRMDYTKAGGKSWRSGTLTINPHPTGWDNRYNGWENYETWNVALWIGNDWDWYCLAKNCKDYAEFVERADGWGLRDSLRTRYKHGATGDGVAWSDPKINVDEINLMIQELT